MFSKTSLPVLGQEFFSGYPTCCVIEILVCSLSADFRTPINMTKLVSNVFQFM